MYKRYCDICGKEISHEEYLGSFRSPEKDKLGTYFVDLYHIEKRPVDPDDFDIESPFGCYSVKKDLCKKCANEMNKVVTDWVERKKKDISKADLTIDPDCITYCNPYADDNCIDDTKPKIKPNREDILGRFVDAIDKMEESFRSLMDIDG